MNEQITLVRSAFFSAVLVKPCTAMATILHQNDIHHSIIQSVVQYHILPFTKTFLEFIYRPYESKMDKSCVITMLNFFLNKWTTTALLSSSSHTNVIVIDTMIIFYE